MKVIAPVPGTPSRFRQVEAAIPTAGRALLDFGAGSVEARVAITGQTGILATSVVQAQKLIAASANHSADEHLVEDLEVLSGFIVPGVGFTIVGRPRVGRLFGAFNVGWSWS